MTALEWLATAGGAALILLVARDVFGTLLHPAGLSTLSARIFLGVWRIAGRAGGRASGRAGPVALLLTAVTWTLGLILGWAFLYWPHLPGAFSVSEGVRGETEGTLLDAIYLSGVALATLGFGDIVAESAVLRLSLVAEALVGFGLLTASITWILSIYPALGRHRGLAGRIDTLLDGGDPPRLVPGDPPAVLAQVLHEVADGIGAARVDLVQYPVTFFFHPSEPALSLPQALGRLEEALRSGDVPPEAAGAARAVLSSVADLGRTLAAGPFGLAGEDPVREYAAAHRR